MKKPTTIVNDDPLITSTEAAAMLCRPRATLETWRCRGPIRIPYIKIGRSVLYRRSAIQALIDNGVRDDE